MTGTQAIKFLQSIGAEVSVYKPMMSEPDVWALFDELGVHKDDVIVHYGGGINKYEVTIDKIAVLLEVITMRGGK